MLIRHYLCLTLVCCAKGFHTSSKHTQLLIRGIAREEGFYFRPHESVVQSHSFHDDEEGIWNLFIQACPGKLIVNRETEGIEEKKPSTFKTASRRYFNGVHMCVNKVFQFKSWAFESVALKKWIFFAISS